MKAWIGSALICLALVAPAAHAADPGSPTAVDITLGSETQLAVLFDDVTDQAVATFDLSTNSAWLSAQPGESIDILADCAPHIAGSTLCTASNQLRDAIQKRSAAAVSPVPTNSQWALLLLALTMAGLAWRYRGRLQAPLHRGLLSVAAVGLWVGAAMAPSGSGGLLYAQTADTNALLTIGVQVQGNTATVTVTRNGGCALAGGCVGDGCDDDGEPGWGD